MSLYIDPNIERKSNIIQDHFSKKPSLAGHIPTFSILEFNITELCNRRCPFCPRSDPKVYPNRKLFMDLALYEKIMKDLAALDYSGKILYSAFSEPLLHKDVEEMIRLSKRHCPGARVETVTDGDFVTLEKLNKLFSAGLDTLLVSMYDGPRQDEHFGGLKTKAGLRDDQMVLRKRYLPPEENYGLVLSNRAGMLTLPQNNVGPLDQALEQKCYYPHYEMMVDWDGAVLLCPHDWGKRIVAGNLKEMTVLEAWTSKALTLARIRLGRGDRKFLPCQACDVRGTLMGEKHFEEWQKHYAEHGDSATH